MEGISAGFLWKPRADNAKERTGANLYNMCANDLNSYFEL